MSLYVRAGSMFESADQNGMTHFIEHLVFRSINRRMGGNLYKTLDRLGLAFSGTTYKEFVQFSVTGAPAHFAEAADIFAMLFLPLMCSAEDVRAERARIKAEIREDGEKGTLDRFTDQLLFEGTTLAQTITGASVALDGMSRKKLEAYRQSMFSAQNVFAYVTGNTSERDAAYLASLCGKASVDTDVPKRENIAPVPSSMFDRGCRVAVKNGQKTVLRFCFDVDMTKITDAELTLLYDILFGDGEECRLHQALSEQRGYIYSFRATLEIYRNIGVISILFEIPPARLDEAVRLTADVLAQARHMDEDSLSYAKAPYIDNAYFCFDDAVDLNWSLAYEKHLLGLPYTTVRERMESFAAVTAERLSLLAAEIFRPENILLTVKGDKKRISPEKLREVLLEGLS